MTASDQEWQDKILKVMRRVAKDLIANDETEISEVVRRRLFQDLGSDKVRKNVCKAFGDWCFEQRAQLPPEWTAVDSAATETKSREFLRRRFEACYPFHPATLSVFQRKWQALPQYQQTRGTLAMLAQWISIAAQESFRKARTEPLITLGSAPLEELGFRSVVTAPACRACGPRAASCSARVARVGGHRRIDQVTNGGGVQDVGPVLEVDQVRQGHGRIRDDQRHVPVRAEAQHLVPRVAGGEPEEPRPGRSGPVPAPAQAQLLDDKSGERLGIALPLVHVGPGERDPVDVAPFVTDDEAGRLARPRGDRLHRHDAVGFAAGTDHRPGGPRRVRPRSS